MSRRLGKQKRRGRPAPHRPPEYRLPAPFIFGGIFCVFWLIGWSLSLHNPIMIGLRADEYVPAIFRVDRVQYSRSRRHEYFYAYGRVGESREHKIQVDAFRDFGPIAVRNQEDLSAAVPPGTSIPVWYREAGWTYQFAGLQQAVIPRDYPLQTAAHLATFRALMALLPAATLLSSYYFFMRRHYRANCRHRTRRVQTTA